MMHGPEAYDETDVKFQIIDGGRAIEACPAIIPQLPRSMAGRRT